MLRYDWSQSDSQFSLGYLVVYELLWLVSAFFLVLGLVVFGLVVWKAFHSRVYRFLPAVTVAGRLFCLVCFISSLFSPLRGQYFGLGLMPTILFFIGFLIIPLSTAAVSEIFNLANEFGLIS